MFGAPQAGLSPYSEGSPYFFFAAFGLPESGSAESYSVQPVWILLLAFFPFTLAFALLLELTTNALLLLLAMMYLPYASNPDVWRPADVGLC